MRIAIIGRTQMLHQTAVELHESGHQVECIVTAKASPESTRDESDFLDLAKRLGARFFLSNTLRTEAIQDACRGLDIGVSMNWVSIVGQEEIDLFDLGILNFHLGDLPRFRGNACPNWAILTGESRVTGTIHFMESGRLDCGRVVCQEHLELNSETTISDIYRWSEESIPGLFARTLKRLAEDRDFSLKYADPNAPEAFRCYPRTAADSFIDWSLPAPRIHSLVRAVCSPFPGAYTYHWRGGRMRKLFVLKTRLAESNPRDLATPGQVLDNNRETGESLIQCGEGVIALSRCRYDGETAEFAPGRRWKSIRLKMGVRVEDWLWESSQEK